MFGNSKNLTFSLLISTIALLPTAFWIFIARVLNAPHCLHASMLTTTAAAAAAPPTILEDVLLFPFAFF